MYMGTQLTSLKISLRASSSSAVAMVGDLHGSDWVFDRTALLLLQ